MRTVEIIVLASLGATGLVTWLPLSARWSRRILTGTGGAILLYLMFHPLRWQLYSGLPGLLLLGISVHRAPGRFFWTLAARGAGTLVAAATIALTMAFPIPDLPGPSGPYPVGTKLLSVVDSSRPGPTGTGYRELPVRVWYPAEFSEEEEREPLWDPSVIAAAPAYAFLSHLRYARTSSVRGAPPRTGPFPLVLYSHGFSDLFTENTLLLEELASHGHVVAAVSHVGWTDAAVFPDGRVVGKDPAWREAFEEAVGREQQMRRVGLNHIEWDSLPERTYWVDRVVNHPIHVRRAESTAEDLRAVVDQAESVEEALGARGGSLLSADRGYAVVGFSAGGSTGTELCMMDRRCRVAVSLDGWPRGSILDGELEVPFLLVTDARDRLDELQVDRVSAAVRHVEMEGATHGSFTDLPYFCPEWLSEHCGPEVPRAVRTQVRLFLDEHLRAP